MGVTYNQNNVSGRRNAGATEYPITIGDGVNSWGRFNAVNWIVGTALANAINSLPTTGGTIEFLSGNFILNSSFSINKSNFQIIGAGANTKIDILNSEKISIVVASGVSISGLRLNAATPARVATTPLLELVAGTSTFCYVTDLIFTEDVGVNTKDMTWTIANGHIVDNNISTTNTSGLGGI